MIMSKIKIRSLGPKDEYLIKDLDPFGRIELLSLPVGFGLCALSEEDDELFMAGIVIGTIFQNDIYIEWMAVDPDRQFNQVGEGLLMEVFGLGIAKKIKYVHAMIHEDYLRKNFSAGGESFFRDHLFERETLVGDDIFVDIKTLLKNSFLSKKPDALGFVALADIPQKDRNDLLLRLNKKNEAMCAVDIMSLSRYIDYDLSVICMGDKDIMAAFLVYKSGAVLVPVYLYCLGDFLLRPIICSSFLNALAKYGKAQKIGIFQHFEGSSAVVKNVLGDWGTMRMLTASVMDYKEILKENG